MITMLWWFLVNSEGTQPHIYEYPFSPKLPSHPACHLTLSIEQSSLCYTVGPYWLSILWPRLLEGLHKCRWFPETNNHIFPFIVWGLSFPNAFSLGSSPEKDKSSLPLQLESDRRVQWRLEWMSPPFAKQVVKSSNQAVWWPWRGALAVGSGLQRACQFHSNAWCLIRNEHVLWVFQMSQTHDTR